MSNVICAIKTVTKPRFINFTNKSIIAIPVTISAFKSGMLVAPNMIALFFFFMALIPIAASVPSSVEIIAAASVIWIVVTKAFVIVSFLKHSAYHFKVNPPHTTRDLELLKDRTINTKIGRYKNKNISAR